MSIDEECPAAGTLEQLRRGDLPSQMRTASEIHLQSCHRCRGLLMSGLSAWSTLGEDEAAQVRPGTVRSVLDRRPAGRFLLLDGEPPSRAGDRAAAYDTLLDRKVMLQFLDREGAASTLGEAAAMERLSHPNLIKVHDAGELDGRVFVATELLDGRSLRQWRQRPRRAREIAVVMLRVFVPSWFNSSVALIRLLVLPRCA